MSISIKRPKALDRMRTAGRIVWDTFQLLAEHIKPGVSLRELDDLAEKYIKSQGAVALYKNYRGSSLEHPPFPGRKPEITVRRPQCHGHGRCGQTLF